MADEHNSSIMNFVVRLFYIYFISNAHIKTECLLNIHNKHKNLKKKKIDEQI